MIYLSICIPYVPEPKSEAHLKNLMALLEPQLTDEVELVLDGRPRGNPTTGSKRNSMYFQAKGLYVCSVDCDDWISPDYVSSILEAIKTSAPDVVTFDGWYTENGINHIDWVIRMGEKYEARHDHASGGKYMIFRFPNHLTAMKKEIAIQYKFPDVTIGEDFQWAKNINGAVLVNGIWTAGPNSLLKTEVHILKQLYHYDYRTDK